jgi:hypothetical protein
VPLFIELQACEFGVMGTIGLHKEFPDGFKILKQRFATKLN